MRFSWLSFDDSRAVHRHFNPISTIIASGGKSCETYAQASQIIYSHRAINSINTHPQLNQQPSGKEP
jgi:hypothetical protein